MRFVAIAAAAALLIPCAHAYDANEKIPDHQALLQLEAKAARASPKEQCFLYAEIVHDMTDEPVVAKSRISAFEGTDLKVLLRSKDIDTPVLSGSSPAALCSRRHWRRWSKTSVF